MHLVSQEGESFDIQVSVAKMSNLVKTMIDGEKRDDPKRYESQQARPWSQFSFHDPPLWSSTCYHLLSHINAISDRFFFSERR